MTVLSQTHPTGLVFVDETSDDLYFGIGCLKLRDPHAVLTAFAELRSENRFQGKLRWADLSGYSAPRKQLVRDTVLMLARDPAVEFNCVLTDLRRVGGLRSYGSGASAYIQLATQAIATCVADPAELIAVIADQFDTAVGTELESKIVRAANDRKKRLGAVTMQRVASAGTDGLQLADLVLGAITYVFRSATKPESDSGKRDIAMALMTDGYGLTAYHDSSGGRSIPGRLTVELLPRRARSRPRGAEGLVRSRRLMVTVMRPPPFGPVRPCPRPPRHAIRDGQGWSPGA
ncbi:MAG: hypothetical protein QOI89_2360 [Solirubrobacteraceae bacterium]|nr:hypothetical protein [Solirubrobacteraceae bacterium]